MSQFVCGDDPGDFIVIPTRKLAVTLVGFGTAAAPLAAQVAMVPEPSDAAPIYHYVVGRDGHATLEDPASWYRNGPGPQSAVEVYDNFRRPDYDPPGQTLIRGTVATAGNEVGDDVTLENFTGGGILDSSGFSIANFSQSDSLSSMHIRYAWYDAGSLELRGSFVRQAVFAFPLPPRSQGFVRFEEGAFVDYAIHLEASMYYTLQWSQPEGVPLEDLGQVYGGPTNTGSSSRYIRDFTNGQMIDLQDPVNNLFMFIRESPVPGVGSSMVICFACIGAARRGR